MKKTYLLILILILVFFSLGLIHQTNLPSQDIGRHIKNGQIIWQTKSIPKTNLYSYAYPDFPFHNHHWLSGIIFYFLFLLIGFKGLIVFKTIILLITFLIVFALSSQKSSFLLTALFSIPVVFLLCKRTEIRPEIFSYLFIAIFLYFLINFAKDKKIFWLVPLQLLWVNLHIYFPIGVLITAGYLFEQIIKRKKIKKLFFLLFLLIIVCFINPAGIKGAVYPFRIFRNYGYQIIENQSPFLLQHLTHDPAIFFFKISIILILISFVFNFKKISFFFFLASTAVIISGWQMVRNLPLVGLIALPVLSINFKKLEKRFKKKTFSFVLILFLLILIILTFKESIQINNKTRGLGLTFQTENSAQFFKNEQLSGPVFNNYDIGSYLIFYLYPQEKVFADNRPEAYPSSFFDEYKEMQQNEEKWQELSQKYNFNVIFFTHQESTPWGRNFVRQRFNDENWPLIYADNHVVIFLKNISENKEIIQKYQITPENIEQRIKPLIDSNQLKVKLAGINLLELINRNDLAMDLAEKMTEQYPKEPRIYLELASLETNTGTSTTNYLTAKRYLERAIQLGENLPGVYVQLGLINFQLNEFEQAKKAWQKALRIDKDNEHAKYYLEEYEKLGLPE